MRPRTTILVFMLTLFSSCGALAQSKKPDSDTVLARVSYSVGGEEATDWQSQDYLPSCFALYRSGYYQMSRTIRGLIPVPGEPGSLPVPSQPGLFIYRNQASSQGRLSRLQLAEFGRMLKNLDFKSKPGGIVRRGSERFVAEVMREDQTIRYVWMNPDHENPFPSSAVRVIDWLQDFDDKDASPLALREASGRSICARASVNPVQPVILEPAQ